MLSCGRWSGRCFIQTDSDGNPNVLGINRNDKGRWLNAYNGNADNRWNRENGFVFLVPQLSSFLPCYGRGVLFRNLSIPTTEHLAHFLYRYRQGDILFIINTFRFPENQ